MLSLRNAHSEVITYWPPEGLDDYGLTRFGTPLKIMGRWENRIVKAVTANGEEFRTQAVVYLAEPVAIGGFLVRGDMREIEDPKMANGQEVKSFSSIPDLRNLTQENKALL